MHMMHLHIRNYKGVTKRNISSQTPLRVNKSGINDGGGAGSVNRMWCQVLIVPFTAMRVAADGATMKPRASYGCRHMAGCLARAGIMVSSHDPL
jgi:hypothetical protein